MKPEGDLKRIQLIAGLGNPGTLYKKTYHSIGIQALEYLLKEISPPAPKIKTMRGFFEYVKIGRIIWVKPLLYMNESGKSLSAALRFFNIQPEHMLVLHDDSDLTIGNFKTSFGAGSAGHKGIESTIHELGTKDFFRVRIGIRPPLKGSKRRPKASAFVLKNISETNQALYSRIFRDIKQVLEKESFNDSEKT